MRYFCSYPSSENKNPFIKIVASHLMKNSWAEFTFVFRFVPIFLNRKKVDIIWFHWPNAHWRHPNLLLKYIKLSRFVIHCLFAKSLGYKLVWSAHNVLPHGEDDSWIELKMRKIISKIMNLVIGHAKNTYEMLLDKGIRPTKYVLAIHGHYEDEYSTRNNSIDRQSLGFANDDIIILLRSGYKNFNSAKVFEECFSNVPWSKLKLLVLGKKIGKSEKIKFVPGFVENSDLSSYMSICDFVCLPYENITTSGAYFLALTFEKPIIARNIPFFCKHSSDRTGLLYDNCVDLIKKLKLIDSNELFFDLQEILKLKKIYSWDNSAKIISNEFNDLIY